VLKMTEVLFGEPDGLIGLEISGQHDGHIVRHVVSLKKRLDLADGGVFEVFGAAEGSLGAVGVVGIERGSQRIAGFAKIAILTDVELFIDGFKFRMEKAKRHHPKPFSFEHHPAFEFVTGNFVDIDGLIQPGIGIGIARADGTGEFVVFIGRGQLGGFAGNGIDFSINTASLLGIGRLAVLFE